MAEEFRTIQTPPAADPAALGLAAFALTTFLLSAANAHLMNSASGDAWLGYAFAYGGLGQVLANHMVQFVGADHVVVVPAFQNLRHHFFHVVEILFRL